MTKRIIILILFFSILSQLVIVDDLKANTAEQRLIEVEKQLQAVANQIKQYEGEKTNLEKAILSNDSALKQVNSELAQVQARLVKAEEALEEALAGYDQSLENLAAVQQNIIQEQTKLGKIKNEITDVKDELFETQKNLNLAKEDLQEQAVELYINGVMSPSTALFIDLNELSDFLAALGYASSIVDSAYEIVEQLNAFERLAETQTEFLTIREEERETSITNLQEEEEKKNQISIEAEEFADDVERKKNIVESEKRQVENKKARVLAERQKAQKLLNQANQQLEKLDKEHADLEKLEDAIQADIDRLMSVGGVAPGKLSWPITGSYVSSGYKWRRLGGTTSFHGAIDIPSSTGTPIKAAAGGVVIVARYYGAAGRTVFIDHGGGMTTLYFHMNKIYVSVGQTVVTGDVIGSVGTTGRTTGPHLHFEVRLKNPSSVNCSRPYLDPTSRGRMNPYCFLDG
jgi:murein DD-endopeptidase MepM/ murein hydrolase activator NlpD|tara:strand:+ start:941 stop:2317 length:1377 start_codon:yes stop_codon:yes gene_type:complete